MIVQQVLSARIERPPVMTSQTPVAESDAPKGADFAVPDNQIDAVLKPHIREEYDTGDLAWREHEERAISKRQLGRRRWLRRILTMGRNARNQADVRTGYETHWSQAESLEHYVSSLNDRTLAVHWRQRGMLVAPQVLRQTQMLYLMRAIEVLKPRTVLEVGFGNGNIILTLAARFPEVKFSGIELTESGVDIAQAVQKQAKLPVGLAENSPEKLLDLVAHQSAELRVGDAGALPFADRSIDLVYTRLALEQMEQIREVALKEICRVSARALWLLEPWRDYNQEDPGRAYIRRAGYFTGRVQDVEDIGFKVVQSTADIPQKIQFNAGLVVAIRD